MATLKNSMGLAQLTTTFSQDGLGDNFSQFINNNNYPYLVNNNLLIEKDLLIDENYLLISFAMSRNDTERNVNSFSKPEIFLAIQGKDYTGSPIVKNIYTAYGTGDNFLFKWDGHFGIGRVRISISKLTSFNQITHIGLIVIRSNSDYGSDAVGKVYKINNTESVSSKLYSATTNGSNRLKKFDGFQETITLNKNYNITEYDSDPYKTFTSFGNSGTSKLVISPITGTLEFSNVVGVGNDNVYTNSKYFYKKIKFSFKNYSLANSEIVPTYMRLSSSDTFLTLTNGQRVYDEINTNMGNIYSTSTGGVQVVYGGYIYTLADKQLKHSSAFFDEVFSEEVFNENFSFYGDRYRTRFLSYGTNGGQECIHLKVKDVSGTLSTKNKNNIPFSGSYELENEGEEKIINISSKTIILIFIY